MEQGAKAFGRTGLKTCPYGLWARPASVVKTSVLEVCDGAAVWGGCWAVWGGVDAVVAGGGAGAGGGAECGVRGAGRRGVRAGGVFRGADRAAEPGAAGGGGAAVRELSHDGAVLADAGVSVDGAESPLERDGVDRGELAGVSGIHG